MHIVLSTYFGDLVLIRKGDTLGTCREILIYDLHVGKISARADINPEPSASLGSPLSSPLLPPGSHSLL